MVSVIQKFSKYSFARWLLCSQGLYRYLYPDNNELKTLAGVPKDKPKGKKTGKSENGKPETFHVPRSLELQLETAPVTALDVVHLRFYAEYLWIVDFSLYTSIVYILSEIYTGIFPLKDEFNLSMVCAYLWCYLHCILLLFILKRKLLIIHNYIQSFDLCLIRLIIYYDDNKLKVLLLNINFAMPFVLVLLWVRPITRHYLTVRVFSGMTTPLMTSQAFDTLRLLLVVVTVVIKLMLMPKQLQAYLDMAQRKLDSQKKEAGRITNIELQKKIASVFYYLCVVALQYICPIILCLFLTLMYKTLGGYTWTGLIYDTEPEIRIPRSVPSALDVEGFEQYQMAWENLKMIFTVEVHRGLLGFASWWCCFSWFLTTSLGTMYQSYFRIS
ncbi:Transmembrane protein 161B [Papilio machaon]|uniref:Transmembrane protein 161B n=1 Tax=Papilio machaon TaxID=76193 RepID=A0A0N1IC97_PAPMA|nr:Transmembrane protein 161B [Papilio machaon]